MEDAVKGDLFHKRWEVLRELPGVVLKEVGAHKFG
jgi:hypothetical protein